MSKFKLAYEPREHQKIIHESAKRWNVLVCHRRFGKTVACIAQLVAGALACDKPRPRFAYIAPLYKQAKTVSWDYLKDYTRDFGTSHESELRVDLINGGRIQLYGADNPDSLRGIYLDGVVMDEYAQMPPSLWAEVIRPALTDRKGWAIFIGTPKGRNSFYEIYEQALKDPDWYAAMFRASETGIVAEEELKAARRQMSEDQYAQEFECSFEAAIPGAYYGRLMAKASDDGRITTVPHDPSVGVETWWDLGIGDSTAIWFVQRVGHEIHAIDYYENSGVGIAHYVNYLEDRRGVMEYNYIAHLVPHDAEGMALATGERLTDTMSKLGLTPTVVPRVSSLESGIEQTRNIIPRTWFDAEKCARGIEALRQYRQEFDEKRQAYHNRPYHDWTSHAADAFRQGAQHRPVTGSWQGPIDYVKHQPKGMWV